MAQPPRSSAPRTAAAAASALLLLALWCAPVAPASAAAADLAAAEPVRVDYYMEALCPYCANFTLGFLQPLFKNKLINHVQLDLIPYGNARTNPHTGAVECQHGEVECQLNKVLSCALAFNPVQDDWFPFLACLEEEGMKGLQPGEGVEAAAHKCAVHAGLVTNKLMLCYKSGLGDTLQRLAAERTGSLKPAHQYVPWVVVNGIPLLEDDENIMRYICVAYRGRDRPKVCLDMPGPAPTAPAGPAAAAATSSSGSGSEAALPAWLRQQREPFERCRPPAAAAAAAAAAGAQPRPVAAA